ncbi:MogA/MoaB family molybdenum cofactor biosynthesis protein [Metabacillus sp. 113a]|uniref:MogA/MoaB family molybdenum cofactor biosynthesis protein n=1 Tax=Metabacillus sp. 113a TaxID=3404706 RepID=UPI003CF3C661
MHKHDQTIAVDAAVLTVSDSRTKENDASGSLIQNLLTKHGHSTIAYSIMKDEQSLISRTVTGWCENRSIQAIIVTGGTGFSPRDITYEAVSRLFDKEMNGFGELFRSLSYDEIGPKAMFSRAAAGSLDGRAIYLLPGSENAVKLGMEKLILPTIQHFIEELNRL